MFFRTNANITGVSVLRQAEASGKKNRTEFSSSDSDRQAKKVKLASIRRKLRAGRRLSPDEMEFLRANDPALYEKAKAIEEERNRLRQQFSRCQSKEEAAQIKNSKIPPPSGASPENGAQQDWQEMYAAALRQEYARFAQSERYGRLPNDSKEKRLSLRI